MGEMFGVLEEKAYLCGMMKDDKDGFRTEKKPSMKRRMNGWDYRQPRIYMITMVTEGRRPLLGCVTGQTEAGQVVAQMHLSALGQFVNGAVERIPRFYPQVRILGKQVMPDHLHFILYVQEELPVPLGKVINGFKVGCNREYRRLEAEGVIAPRRGEDLTLLQSRGTLLQSSKAPDTGSSKAPDTGSSKAPDTGGVSWAAAEQTTAARTGQEKGKGEGLLWETGYHDRVLSGRDQLQRMMDYIHDNPRRLFLKRMNADYFRQTDFQLEGRTLYAVGNLQLLQQPKRIPVKCSRSLSDEAIAQYRNECLQEARAGAVLVSPFISRGEKAVEQAALEAGLPVVKLLDNGFPECYKPWGLLFDACVTGRLLLLTPYSYQTGHHTVGRAICNDLNEITGLLCS
ncbi:MAG: hypothetical protein IJT97_06865 [Bacteroidaceae bacterium]|nr:hypothetical protein [Bacteroidaceae bacterium]